MGGIGSGRYWNGGGRATTESYRRLDVRRLARDGLLRPGRAGRVSWSVAGNPAGRIALYAIAEGVVLDYSHQPHDGDWEPKQYLVRIEHTACALGGSRPWFLCPARGCGRRVAILYGGAIFACRHCHRLAYPSTRESVLDRATRRADRLRERLGWEPGILNGTGDKPKWMRWRTFQRLTTQHDRLLAVSLHGFESCLRELGLDDL
jgi:hypothetical protein